MHGASKERDDPPFQHHGWDLDANKGTYSSDQRLNWSTAIEAESAHLQWEVRQNTEGDTECDGLPVQLYEYPLIHQSIDLLD